MLDSDFDHLFRGNRVFGLHHLRTPYDGFVCIGDGLVTLLPCERHPSNAESLSQKKAIPKV